MTESTQTTTPQISESKPTLAELVGATPEISTETPPIQSVGLESKEQTDLEALLKSENPGINTTPQEQIVSTPTLENIPIIENNESTNVENPSTEVHIGLFGEYFNRWFTRGWLYFSSREFISDSTKHYNY